MFVLIVSYILYWYHVILYLLYFKIEVFNLEN